MAPPDRSVAGLAVSRAAWDAAPEYFPYLVGRDAFDRLDTRRYDVVVSTQPPSFSHRHPRHLAVFTTTTGSSTTWRTCTCEPGSPPTRRCTAAPASWCAGSTSPHRGDPPRPGPLADRGRPPRALQRHHRRRLPARGDRRGPRAHGSRRPRHGLGALHRAPRVPQGAELAVAAAHLLPHLSFTVVGSGGRMAWARALDHRLSQPGADPTALTDDELWCNTGRGRRTCPTTWRAT
ncbi:MAG: hypothetical protein R2746_06505 [Acidimicrobiales bacterium]